MNFLWKKEKLQNRKNCILTKNTFYPISPVLINLQTCTIPHFKGNFIINDSFYIMDESQWLPALLQKKVSVYFFSWHPLLHFLSPSRRKAWHSALLDSSHNKYFIGFFVKLLLQTHWALDVTYKSLWSRSFSMNPFMIYESIQMLCH